jgi:hypothetical protein
MTRFAGSPVAGSRFVGPRGAVAHGKAMKAWIKHVGKDGAHTDTAAGMYLCLKHKYPRGRVDGPPNQSPGAPGGRGRPLRAGK